MLELWDQLQQQPVAEPPSLWPGGDRAPLRITVGGPTMKDGAQASPGSSLDPFNPPQVQYVGTPLANTLWSALKEMGVKGQRLLSGLQQYSGEQFPASTGTQTMSTDTEPVKQAVENMDPMLANLWGVGSASVPRGAVGAIGSSPFYSAAQRAVENAKLGKGTPDQWLGYLRNQPGVKGEEVERMFGNLPQQGMLTKEQMQAHAAENAVTLEEVTKGTPNKPMPGESSIDASWRRDENPTKYSQWQLPGGENYREKLLTLPGQSKTKALDEFNSFKRQLEQKYGTSIDSPYDASKISGDSRIADQYEVLLKKAQDESFVKSNDFQSSHWDEPNVLAHIRMNDREVPGVGRSLHLEEIQSDWHQKGRQQGYAGDPVENRLKVPVPDAPFKTTWPDVALKRSIRDAAEGGYDALSWTPGEAQAARYDLSKQVKRVYYLNDTQTLRAMGHDGSILIDEVVPKEKVADHIGKEAAQKLFETPVRSVWKDRTQDLKGHDLSGLDLKVGGEGMKAFYDKMLVDKANALGKKHGARVEQAEIDTKPERGPVPEGSHDFSRNAPVHVLRITPQLREAAMKGFPLFSALFGGVATAPSLWPQQGRQ